MEYSFRGEMLARFAFAILILILVLNSALIIGVQMLLGYPLRTPQEAIAEYTEYNLVDTKVNDRSAAYLLAAPGRENRLVVTGKHFLMNRHEVLLDQEVDRKFSAELKADTGTVLVRISENSGSLIGGFAVRSGFKVPIPFVLWNILLIVLEILGWNLISKLRKG